MGPWAHGPMSPWAHGPMAHGSWAHGPWAHGPWAQWPFIWAHGPWAHGPFIWGCLGPLYGLLVAYWLPWPLLLQLNIPQMSEASASNVYGFEDQGMAACQEVPGWQGSRMHDLREIRIVHGAA